MRAPLESMRVAKPAQPSARAIERDGATKAQEAKARLTEEEGEWQVLLARAKAETAAAEAVEWAAMRERAAAATRIAEEREWSERIARARTTPVNVLSPWPAPIVQRPREQPQIVLWP
jgi:hypothetical protein